MKLQRERLKLITLRGTTSLTSRTQLRAWDAPVAAGPQMAAVAARRGSQQGVWRFAAPLPLSAQPPRSEREQGKLRLACNRLSGVADYNQCWHSSVWSDEQHAIAVDMFGTKAASGWVLSTRPPYVFGCHVMLWRRENACMERDTMYDGSK
jgi:hypothetical protein